MARKSKPNTKCVLTPRLAGNATCLCHPDRAATWIEFGPGWAGHAPSLDGKLHYRFLCDDCGQRSDAHEFKV